MGYIHMWIISSRYSPLDCYQLIAPSLIGTERILRVTTSEWPSTETLLVAGQEQCGVHEFMTVEAT